MVKESVGWESSTYLRIKEEMSSYRKLQTHSSCNSVCSNLIILRSSMLNVSNFSPWTLGSLNPHQNLNDKMSQAKLTSLLSKCVDNFLLMNDSILQGVTWTWNQKDHCYFILSVTTSCLRSTVPHLLTHLPLCLIHFAESSSEESPSKNSIIQ